MEQLVFEGLEEKSSLIQWLESQNWDEDEIDNDIHVRNLKKWLKDKA